MNWAEPENWADTRDDDPILKLARPGGWYMTYAFDWQRTHKAVLPPEDRPGEFRLDLKTGQDIWVTNTPAYDNWWFEKNGMEMPAMEPDPDLKVSSAYKIRPTVKKDAKARIYFAIGLFVGFTLGILYAWAMTPANATPPRPAPCVGAPYALNWADPCNAITPPWQSPNWRPVRGEGGTWSPDGYTPCIGTRGCG